MAPQWDHNVALDHIHPLPRSLPELRPRLPDDTILALLRPAFTTEVWAEILDFVRKPTIQTHTDQDLKRMFKRFQAEEHTLTGLPMNEPVRPSSKTLTSPFKVLLHYP